MGKDAWHGRQRQQEKGASKYKEKNFTLKFMLESHVWQHQWILFVARWRENFHGTARTLIRRARRRSSRCQEGDAARRFGP